MRLLYIPEDVLQYTLLFMDAQDMCRLECTCSLMKQFIETTNQWKLLCDRDFKGLSRYNCQKFGYPNASYKVSYRHIFTEVRRTVIAFEDLESREWFFSLAHAAGGRGAMTLVKGKFRNCLFQTVLVQPPLPYFVSKRGSLVVFGIADFSPLEVSRLPDGEWMIKNHAATFVSTGPEGVPNYHNWGFLS